MAREDLRAAVDRQVQATLAEGAHLATGGHIPAGPGWYYPPTVLTGVQPHMTAGSQELFGPVAAVMEATDAEDAVRQANASSFGLGGNIWTRDVERGKQLARRIESGAVFVNGMTASDARLPFGGVKESGYGRELSTFGLREFTNVQTTWVGPSIEAPGAVPAE
jgi:succinate-semialdehyde dehydrogenase/glutarate-semialdehyde dehydrogenase